MYMPVTWHSNYISQLGQQLPYSILAPIQTRLLKVMRLHTVTENETSLPETELWI